LAHPVAVCLGRLALELAPLFIGQEGAPGALLRLEVGPLEDVRELAASVVGGLPRGEHVEAMAGHDPQRVVTEPGAERGLVPFEGLVNAELPDHGDPVAPSGAGVETR